MGCQVPFLVHLTAPSGHPCPELPLREYAYYLNILPMDPSEVFWDRHPSSRDLSSAFLCCPPWASCHVLLPKVVLTSEICLPDFPFLPIPGIHVHGPFLWTLHGPPSPALICLLTVSDHPINLVLASTKGSWYQNWARRLQLLLLPAGPRQWKDPRLVPSYQENSTNARSFCPKRRQKNPATLFE